MKTITIVNRNVPFKETYSATGIVLGNYWGGGKGTYSAKRLSGYASSEELLKKAEEMLKDGSLDAGMGYESLIGARLALTKTTTIVLDEQEFTNQITVGHFIGD